jgi:hypothetical protein
MIAGLSIRFIELVGACGNRNALRARNQKDLETQHCGAPSNRGRAYVRSKWMN